MLFSELSLVFLHFTFKPLIFQPSIIQDGHEAQTFDSV